MGWAGRPRSARTYSSAGPNMSAVRSRFAGCAGRVCCGCPPHCFGLRSPALQTSPQTYATSLVSSLCAPASRPYPEMQPHLYRTRLSLLAPNVAYLARLRYLAVENEGVLPEIRWLSSNVCALGCTLESSTGVGNEKPQVNVLCLLS